MAGADWIGLVERAYSLEGTEQEWLRGVVEAAMPLLDHGLGAASKCTLISSCGYE